MLILNRQNGQTLIEALVSLSVAVAVIGVITVVVISSLNNATFTKNQNQATLFAQDGLEVTRRIALSNTTEFISASGKLCYDEGKTILTPLTVAGAGGCGFNVKGSFSREIEIYHSDPDCGNQSQVIVRVKWSDNKCDDASVPFCHEVELSSCMSGYNPSKSSEENPI